MPKASREYKRRRSAVRDPLANELTDQETKCAKLLIALARGKFGQTQPPNSEPEATKDEAIAKGLLNKLLRLRERTTEYRTYADRIKDFEDDPKCASVSSLEKSVRCLDCPPGKKNEWQLDKRGRGYDYNWHKHKASHCADRLVALFKRLECLETWPVTFLVDLDQNLTFTRSLSDENGEELTEEEKEDLECLYKQTKLKIKRQGE